MFQHIDIVVKVLSARRASGVCKIIFIKKGSIATTISETNVNGEIGAGFLGAKLDVD